jgi:hypothetical protein
MKTELNQITTILLDTMKDLKTGNISFNVGNSINRTASQAIRASIVDRELSIRESKQKNISKHIELQYAKLKNKN